MGTHTARKVLPPDFRYVWLLPTSSRPTASLGAGAVALAALSGGLWSAGLPSLSFGLTLGASALAALALAKSGGIGSTQPGAHEVAMAIVPWGVIVEPDANPHALRWAAIRKVSVDVCRTLRGGTPTTVSSLVTLETEHGRLAGRARGEVDLERLLVNLTDYAEEAARPVALDLDGATRVSPIEPVFARLLDAARQLCSTARGATGLGLPPGGYRRVALSSAGPETAARLRSALRADDRAEADPRALAAALAGELGATELTPELLGLVTCPHPVIAAVAKAAALRLGEPRARVGSIDEVAAFLCEDDLGAMALWSERRGS